MRRTLVSMAIGISLACSVFWVLDAVETIKRAAEIAELQAQAPADWLELSPMIIEDGKAAPDAREPIAVWTAEAKRTIEVRAAVTTRNLATGDPICIGGTNTVITEPTPPRIYNRVLSRLAGVESCEWPAGEYRSRITWTITDPATRVSKTVIQETEPFNVLP